MNLPRACRTLGALALGAVPLAYAQVPYLPPLLRALPLLAAGAAFALGLSLEAAALSPAMRRAGAWAAAWLAFQVLSALWGTPGWAAASPLLDLAAALAIAAGIASAPDRRRILSLAGIGASSALLLYGVNVLSGGGLEAWFHGARLSNNPVDHLPFGNHNTAALLIAALIPPLTALAWGSRSFPRLLGGLLAAGLAALLWHMHSLGALLGLAAGGVLTLAARSRRAWLLHLCLLALLLAGPLLAWGLARLPQPPPWRMTTTFGLRTLVWESAGNAWKAAPWRGGGAGSFPLRFPDVMAADYPYSRYAQPLVRHAYNLPLQILAETGLAGALLAAGALAALLAAWREGSRGPALWSALALLVQALGGDALSDPLGLACFSLAAGCALPPGRELAIPRHPGAWRLAGLALAGGLLLQLPQASAYLAAHAAAGRGDETGAEAGYARAATGLPSLTAMDARFERGRCLLHLGRDREALAAGTDLMRLAGPYGNARAQTALAALRCGETAEAVRLLEAHLRFNPCDLKARRLLAQLAPERAGALASELRAVIGKVPEGHPLLEELGF